MSSSLNVLTTHPSGLRGSVPTNRPRQATYDWKDPITTCSSWLYVDHQHAVLRVLLICCVLPMFPPRSLWAELGETVRDDVDAALLPWPRVCSASSQDLPSFAHSCRRSWRQDPAAGRPITGQTGFGSGQSVVSSRASIPRRSAASCLILLL